MTLPRLIDIHHHLIPPAFTREMEARGISEVAGAPLPSWTPDKSIENMNVHGIATAITSLSAPGVYFGDRSAAVLLARACNEYAAEMVGRYPGRFGSFAVLPMPFAEESCEEAVFALDVFKADGIVLLGSTDGRFLGDPQFDELMVELDRRSATVFVHPNLHKSGTELGLAAPGFLVEFPCDTTRAATNLILTGTVEKYSHIRWILAHAGGFLPYIAWRLSLANEIPHLAIRAPEGILSYIRRFYYDTALSPSPFAMAALRELVSPDHILFGSDYPFAPATVTGLEVGALEKLTIFDAETKAGIARGNALALFPHFAGKADEQEGLDLATDLKRAMTAPIETLVERLRNR